MGAVDKLWEKPTFPPKVKKTSNQAKRALREIRPRAKDSEYDFHFRTDRIFAVGHQWYFSTREEVDFGPYDKKERAQEALRTFLMLVA